MGKHNNHTDVSNNESNANRVSSNHADDVNTENIGSGGDTSTEHTKPFMLEHPVDDVAELHGSEYGQYLLREAQVKDGVAPGDRSAETERHVEKEFDLRVIDTTDRILRHPVTDATPEEFPIEDSAVVTLVLQRVRNAPANEFTAHLRELPNVREKLGVTNAVDKNTLTEWEDVLTETDAKAIDACAKRVLYAVYRSGQPFPQAVWDATVATRDSNLLTTAEKNHLVDGHLPKDVARTALRNWALEFLHEVVQDEFSLGRDQSKTFYSVMSIVGLFAHAALQSRTLTESSKTCAGWYVDPGLVPDRTTVLEPIGELSIDEIATLFVRLNRRFLEFADEYTILHGSKQLAYDPTDIPCSAGNLDDRWLKGYCETLKGDVSGSDVDQKREFGLAAMTEPDVRFALGMYPIKKRYRDEEQDRQSVRSADVVSRLLRPICLNTPVTIDLITMDGELSGADMIRRCRETLGDNWIIRGKNEREVDELVEETPEDETRFVKLESYFKDLSCKPNAIIVPTPYGASTNDSQWVFLTDLPREAFVTQTDDGTEVLDKQIVISRYQNRCRVEKTIEQLKNGFHIPVREGTNTRVKYFTLNMSMLFHNLHNLIINSISPRYGLPLGKTREASNGQVLSAIREVAFELADEQQNG